MEFLDSETTVVEDPGSATATANFRRPKESHEK